MQIVAASAASANSQKPTTVASTAADMWSLGLLAYEMMAGQPMFGTQYSNNDVIAMLLGYALSLLLSQFHEASC